MDKFELTKDELRELHKILNTPGGHPDALLFKAAHYLALTLVKKALVAHEERS